jgi:hypothetical protein
LRKKKTLKKIDGTKIRSDLRDGEAQGDEMWHLAPLACKAKHEDGGRASHSAKNGNVEQEPVELGDVVLGSNVCQRDHPRGHKHDQSREKCAYDHRTGNLNENKVNEKEQDPCLTFHHHEQWDFY